MAEADRDRLAAIVSSSVDAFISCDREGRITGWNAAAERIFGSAASEVLGTPITGLAPPDREALARDVLERTLRGEPIETCEARVARMDGTSLDVELTVTPIRATDGTVTGVSAEVRDIGERRRAQRTVAHQTRILATVRDALIETDLEFRIVRWSPAAEQLYGWKESEVIGRPVGEVLQTRLLDTDDETVLRALAEDGHVLAQALQQTRGGVEVNVEASVIALRDGAGAPVGYVSLDRDVRARRRLEERLREARQLEAIGRLAGGIAHDFNNLLTALLGFGDLVLDEPDLPAGVRADVEEMVRIGGHAGTLTRQLIAFSRQQLLEPRAVDLNSIVRESTATLGRVAGAAVEIEHRLAPDLALAEVDAAQIEKVLHGLVENAGEAMPGGGRLTIGTANGAPGAEPLEGPPAGDYVVLTVSDTGCGMDGETRARVFEPYFTTKATGAGLGLATIYGIVRQSGGEITVSSRPGSGSQFAVFLPRAAPAEIAAADSARAAGGNPTVLVVDDEVTIRTLMTRILRRDGCTVLETGAPEQAIELARGAGAGLSLLISDVVLPGLSGAELCERIATLCPGVRILLVSGYPEDERVRDLVAGHRVAYLGKPFTPDMLMSKVREALAAPA